MLVKFTQNSKNETNAPIEPNTPVVEAKDIVGEVSRVRLSEDDLSVLEGLLLTQSKPTEELVKPSVEPLKNVDEDFDGFVPEPFATPEEVVEQKIDEPIIEKWEEILPHNLRPMDENSPIIDLVKPEETQTIDEPQPINEPVTEFVPALGDNEVKEMVLDEWERKFDLVEDESEEGIPEPAPIPLVVEETPLEIPVIEEPIIEEVIEEPITDKIISEVIPEPIKEEVIVKPSVESLSEPTDEEKKN
jgi:hypothetical protein